MLKLKRHPNNPILEPSARYSWEAQAAFNGSPCVDGKVTHLVYRALSYPQEHHGQTMELSTVGYAQKIGDTEFQQKRQLIVPEESWERFGCEDPRITKLDDTYYITYTALEHYPFGPAGIKIALAKTKDFKKITKRLATPFNSKAMVIFPERVNGKITALLTVDCDLPPSSICLAQADKVEDFWEYDYWDRWYSFKKKQTLPLLRSLADHIEVGAPPVKTAKGWLFVYSYISAYLTNTKQFAVEAILLDLDDPTRVIGQIPYSILEAETLYEKKGLIDNIVFPTGLLINGDQLDLYYGGADKVCAIASCSLKTLLKEMKAPLKK
jgi:predicted GH43/DUF377 family glycosyl hydrolase